MKIWALPFFACERGAKGYHNATQGGAFSPLVLSQDNIGGVHEVGRG